MSRQRRKSYSLKVNPAHKTCLMECDTLQPLSFIRWKTVNEMETKIESRRNILRTQEKYRKNAVIKRTPDKTSRALQEWFEEWIEEGIQFVSPGICASYVSVSSEDSCRYEEQKWEPYGRNGWMGIMIPLDEGLSPLSLSCSLLFCYPLFDSEEDG